MDPTPAPSPRKKILKIVLWLWTLFPVGLWMLWHDEELSTTAKWRTLCYGLIIPFMAYLAIGAWKASSMLNTYLP